MKKSKKPVHLPTLDEGQRAKESEASKLKHFAYSKGFLDLISLIWPGEVKGKTHEDTEKISSEEFYVYYETS